MKGMRTLTALLVTMLMIGAVAPLGIVAADVQSDATFEGDVEDGVSVENETITADPATTEIDVSLSYNVSEYDNVSNESVIVETDFEAVSDISVNNSSVDVSESTSGGTTTYTLENVTVNGSEAELNVTLQLTGLEDGDNYSEAFGHSLNFTHTNNSSVESQMHNGTTYDLEAQSSSSFEGGTIGNLPVPSFFQQYGALGAFAFYAVIVGGVLAAGIALYLVATGEGLTRGERTTATAMVSFGSLSGIWSAVQENMMIVIVVAVAFLALAVVLWRRDSDMMTMKHDGTEYWD